MKIIKDELSENGNMVLTTDEPIKLGHGNSVFRDNNGLEWFTIASNKIELIQKTKDGIVEYPTSLQETGTVFFGEASERRELRNITFEI